jgi:hypothetical protein
MRRKSYLTRIVEDATAKRQQPALAPPRLLFRPESTQFDVGMDTDPGSTRGRSNAARATGSQTVTSQASDSQFTGSQLADLKWRLSGRPDMTAPTGDADPTSAQGEAALLRRAFQKRETTAERNSPARASSLRNTQHEVSDDIENLASSASQDHDPKPTSAASVLMRPRKGDRGPMSEGDGDDFARDAGAGGAWRRVTSERAARHRTSPKAEVIPRLDLNPREPRRDAQASKDEGGGRVRIGTLELRILPAPNTPREVPVGPAPARRVAAPASPARPLSRGFGVFGLPQS